MKHGFKPIEFEAKKIVDANSTRDTMSLASELLKSEAHQVRCLAVFLLGFIASKNTKALDILRAEVSRDSSWQVQEILAKSSNRYCRDIGYENALLTIKNWLMIKVLRH